MKVVADAVSNPDKNLPFFAPVVQSWLSVDIIIRPEKSVGGGTRPAQ